VLLQTALCQTQNTPPWMTAAWTSPPASSGRPTCPTNSTRCKRDTPPAHHERRLPLEEPRWYPHRKITGVQGPALVERMAPLLLLATFVIVGMTRGVRRYPALAPRPTRLDCCIQACTADHSHRRTHHQSRASIQRLHPGLKVLVAPSKAKAVRPQHAPIALPRPRLCGAVTPKAIHSVMRAVCS
jgi:hypothetical protein